MAKPSPRSGRTIKQKTAGPSVRDAPVRDVGSREAAQRPKGVIDKVVDKIDRVARRPFMQGDYMPGEIRDRGTCSDDCDTGRRPSGRSRT